MSGRVNLTAQDVARLVAAQFPQWADLSVWPVDLGGWDNRTFRLGSDMLVRLPSAKRYVAQVEKEQIWLPKLAPQLPLRIPAPLAAGKPDGTYPWPWSIYRWIDGEPASPRNVADMPRFARDLAGFLGVLQAIDGGDGPAAGRHNFWRGGPVSTYDGGTRQAITKLAREIDTDAATEVWETALASHWDKPPVWIHGDVAAGNLLVRDGRLCAVIDFGTCGVGDPACDLYIAWTFLDAWSRDVFRRTLGLDDATWQRGRGWTLWKALILRAEHGDRPPLGPWALTVIEEVLAEHSRR